MTTDDRLAAAWRQLAELEAAVLQALASARGSLAVVEEENRCLRREEIKRRTEFYTEEEVARLLKVHVSTLQRLRRKRGLDHLLVGQQVRYSTQHLQSAEEELRGGKTGSAGSKKSQLRRVG